MHPIRPSGSGNCPNTIVVVKRRRRSFCREYSKATDDQGAIDVSESLGEVKAVVSSTGVMGDNVDDNEELPDYSNAKLDTVC